ncbi:hypothetical protein DFS34DRAFT_412855 [Phlyctochytrium arcticum]|nr:hypothetical protein DFS34DRAFT_412855 [Phlyctochytrium arcticum]
MDRSILQHVVEIYENHLRELLGPPKYSGANRTRMRSFRGTETFNTSVGHRRRWSNWQTRFNDYSRAQYKHWMGTAHDDWSNNNYGIKTLSLNLLCRQVEVASQGVHETPAWHIWGEGYFADICQYDFFNRAGYAWEASQSYSEFMANGQDDYPADTVNAHWFRDWYYPLWAEKGNTLAWHTIYFALLAQYFPSEYVNNGMNLKYSRRMDTGEYIHFMSATVGRNLVPMAISAFNSGYKPAQFTAARSTFPALNSMYTYP